MVAAGHFSFDLVALDRIGFGQLLVQYHQQCRAHGTDGCLRRALLVTETSQGGGTVNLANRFNHLGFTVEAPVFDVDGVTKLAGAAFAAQLYAGPSLEMLRPAGPPAPFRSGFLAGLVQSAIISIPTVAPFSTAFVQLRAWEASKGVSYEEARALGGKFGRSEVLQVVTGGEVSIPPNLVGLQSFSLQAGLPHFNVGVIELADRQPDGAIIWSLRGEAGLHYLVETATAGFVWRPLMVLTNLSGTVTFVDPTSPPAGGVFYRSRVLD